MRASHILAINLKKYRVQLGITQEKLAEMTGLHRTYISLVERERRNISIDNLDAIATALGIEPYQLLEPLNDKDGGTINAHSSNQDTL